MGSTLVRLAFSAALLSTGSYFYAAQKSRATAVQIGRTAYQICAVLVLGFAALLLSYILTHQFQYTYVWSYSSTTLPTPLLISTFYAGQEGSFSLWTLYSVVIGIILIQYTSKRDYEAHVMAVWSGILSFLLLMLIVKNPFTMIWDSFPNDLLHTGAIPPEITNFVWVDRAREVWAQIPVEGRGLNPLLQNYWMVIHPQILFTGFSSMAVPYAFAVAGLWKRDYQRWITIAKPWTVFGSAVLGTGIILGGYWAYETLGWGGYWGWDPVENSSLIPWLVCVASIHTMMAQLRSGVFMRTNFLMSIFCYIMVLYSTFLTRSGVLGDTSVHSFVSPGMWAYWLLLAVIVVFGLAGLVLLLVRMREMPRVPVEHHLYSREFALLLGAFTICFAAIFITLGTSSPIITNILKGKAAAVETSYYVKTTLPLGIVIALLAGIGQLLWWQASDARRLFASLRYPLLTAVLFTGAIILFGVRDLPIIILAFASAFALFVNLAVGYRIFTGNPKYAGGAIAHIGFALLFLGFIASARYDDKQTVSLEEGRPVQVFNDYTLTYVGNRQIDAEQYGFTVDVRHGESDFTVTPVIRYNSQENSSMRHPDILNLYTKDFYVSPLSVETPKDDQEDLLTFSKNETKEINHLRVTFLDYDFSDVEKGKMATGGAFSIGVLMQIEKEGKTYPLRLKMKNEGGSVDFIPASIEGDRTMFVINRVQPNREDPSQSKVTIGVRIPDEGGQKKPQKETLIIEASIKPFINLVWMGTITLVVGFIITIIRRVEEARSERHTS